jgi:hypothetical protein
MRTFTTMTERQEQHLDNLMGETLELMDEKYRRGQEVHGGDLFELSVATLLDEAINETVDQLVYLLTAKARLGGQIGNQTHRRS